jgi:Zn-finger nucleic acid-binding protein
MSDKTWWYRFDDVMYAPMPSGEYGEWVGPSTLKVELHKYQVVKITPCGVWLDVGKFVKTAARKRFACPTEAEARESFLARKKRQLSILSAQVSRVERAIQSVTS